MRHAWMVVFLLAAGCGESAPVEGVVDLAVNDLRGGTDLATTSPLCPSQIPVAGTTCAAVMQCSYQPAGCPVRCGCEWVQPLPMTPPKLLWTCETIVHGGCTSPVCPSTVPSLHPACKASPGGTLCSYVDQPSDCTSSCICDGSSLTWGCSATCKCPATAPRQWDPCRIELYQKQCSFASTSCRCTNHLHHPDPYWDCSTRACAASPPANGAPCDPVQDVDQCTYSRSPYCGTCTCLANGTWSCTPSTCDRCPATAPLPGADCAGFESQSCTYPTQPFSTTCDCDQIGSPRWRCRM